MRIFALLAWLFCMIAMFYMCWLTTQVAFWEQNVECFVASVVLLFLALFCCRIALLVFTTWDNKE